MLALISNSEKIDFQYFVFYHYILWSISWHYVTKVPYSGIRTQKSCQNLWKKLFKVVKKVAKTCQKSCKKLSKKLSKVPKKLSKKLQKLVKLFMAVSLIPNTTTFEEKKRGRSLRGRGQKWAGLKQTYSKGAEPK